MRTSFNHTNATRQGMTMIEMLVAVAILSFIILAFGTILTQTQKVVKTSQKNMRTNGTASAIAKVIRDDLRQLTQTGFLCITQKSTANSAPRLIFTTAGATPSKTDDVIGSGAIVVLGRKENEGGIAYGGDNGFGGNYSLLAQQKWVLDSSAITTSPNPDVWLEDLSAIQKLSLEATNDLIGLEADTPPPISLLYNFKDTELKVPPHSQQDISNLWQVLSFQCDNVTIMWTDGDDDGDGDLDWYGVTNSGGSEGDVIIKNPAGGEVSDLPDYEIPGARGYGYTDEADLLANRVEFETDGGYRALWTHHNPNNWPKAIKISFAIHDPETSEEMQGEDSGTTFKRYEIICPIGR